MTDQKQTPRPRPWDLRSAEFDHMLRILAASGTGASLMDPIPNSAALDTAVADWAHTAPMLREWIHMRLLLGIFAQLDESRKREDRMMSLLDGIRRMQFRGTGPQQQPPPPESGPLSARGVPDPPPELLNDNGGMPGMGGGGMQQVAQMMQGGGGLGQFTQDDMDVIQSLGDPNAVSFDDVGVPTMGRLSQQQQQADAGGAVVVDQAQQQAAIAAALAQASQAAPVVGPQAGGTAQSESKPG